MVVNPNSFRYGNFDQLSPQDYRQPSFSDTLSASFGYTYDPAYEAFQNRRRFGTVRQEGYNPLEDLGEYSLHAMELRSAVSPEHMIEMKRGIDESLERRRVLGESSFISQLGAGLFDPLNFLALPFGGPTWGIGRSALRVGAGTAAIQAGVEATLIQPYDAVQTSTESAVNVAGAFLFGGAMGGAVSIPITKRAAAYTKIKKSLENQAQALRQIEYASELTADDFGTIGSPELRPLSEVAESDINKKITELTAKQQQLVAAPEEVQLHSATEIQLEEVSVELSLHKREHAIRKLESDGFDQSKMWSMADNVFTDSGFYKFVSTPFKRIIQSNKATASIKEATVRLAGDAGINYVMNTFGFASPLSVHQRAAARNGQWVKAHDELIRLFREDVGLSNTSRLDVDPVLAWRSLTNRDDSYGNWLRRINEKRTKKDTNLSDLEKRSISIIDEFFKKAERELNDVGLIGSTKSITNRLKYIERQLLDLEDSLAKMGDKAKFAKLREEDLSRKRYLERQKSELEASLQAFRDEPQELTDNFLPRFWDMGAIKARRGELFEILFKHYSENPTIWMFKNNKWQLVRLKTDRGSIEKRVNETIDTILGDKNPTDEANIGFGYGRSKHFRHRQVDIPNELVWDFIVQDPIAIMKTYTARVAPRLEFRKQFGGDVDDVAYKLRRDMVAKGFSEDQINKDMKDFMILYDRIAGAVLDNPSALSQRTAYIMKEAASLNYMGGAWAAAIPEFGRIIMEHDGGVMVKAMQGMLDKEVLAASAAETRMSGESVDIVRGTAHVRLVDDMANNVDAGELWNKARNAYYVLNGLGPVTQISKMLDGMARAHTIIERSVKLSEGKATEFEKTWLARNGISNEVALEIAKAPWEKANSGLILANTEQWLDSIYVPEIDGKRVNIIESNEDGSPVGITSKGRYVPARYNRKSNTIFFDREYIEGKYFEDKVWLNPRMEGVKPLEDVFKTPKSWSNFVMLHEIMHKRFSAADVGIYAEQSLKKKFEVNLEFEDEALNFSRVYMSPKKLLKEIEYINSEIDRQRQLLEEALELQRDDIAEDLLPNFNANTVIRDDLVKISESNSFKEQIEIEKGLSPAKKLSQKQVVEYENKINELAFAEWKKQSKVREQTVSDFRAALNTGILNTIMMATPADRPIISDGVAFVPYRIAKKFGYSEDKRYKGYSRIENGFMALPFQFYSYTLANVNKMVGGMAHGQMKNRVVGVAAMLGLGYLSVKAKTPDFVWEDMEWRDRFARAYDSSGLTALYSDLFYTSMHTSLALGGPNITNGYLSPKYPQEPSMADAITGLAGAGPSITYDIGAGAAQFVSGDYGEGAKNVFRNLPFTRMWFWKDEMNQMTRAWSQ